jgi:hypothetical protein
MGKELNLQEVQDSILIRLQSMQQDYKELAAVIYEVPLESIDHRQMCFAKLIKAVLMSQVEMVIH